MKYLILILGLLSGCSFEEYVGTWPVVAGEVYNREYYLCQFGVLYYSRNRIAFVGRNGNPVQCENVLMTEAQYCQSRKPAGAVFYGCNL